VPALVIRARFVTGRAWCRAPCRAPCRARCRAQCQGQRPARANRCGFARRATGSALAVVSLP